MKIGLSFCILIALFLISCEKKASLPESADRKTLKDFGEYLTDTNKVYHRYETDDEVLILELEGADRPTFQTFGSSIYAKDKHHVYDSRHGVIEKADVNTFQVVNIESNGRVAYGKDKDNYFFWNGVVTDTIGFGDLLKK
jgi:hypothetical protein